MCTRKAAIAILSAIVLTIVPQEVRAQTLLDHVRSFFLIEREQQLEYIEPVAYRSLKPVRMTELALNEVVEFVVPEIVQEPPVVYPAVFDLETSSSSHNWTAINNWLLSGLPAGTPEIDPTIDIHALSVDREQFLCLATNIYFEARGSTISDQRAVAHVTLNRTRHWRWSGAICDVVWERAQFSWTLTANQRNMRVRTPQSWVQSQRVAYEVLRGFVPDITNGSTNYYNPSIVRPAWASMAIQSQNIGAHRYVVLRTTSSYDPPANIRTVRNRLYSHTIRAILRQMGIG